MKQLSNNKGAGVAGHNTTTLARGETLVISRAIDNAIAEITLSRPTARNALSLAMIADLHAALRDLGADQSVRAIIISAEGPVFSAGHDLKELTAHRGDGDGGRRFFNDTMNACADMMCAISACPVPVLAAVQGVATAAGCQLVAACDLAIAEQHVRFQTPGVNIGLFCSTPMVALSRVVPRKHALDMLFCGEPVTAADARTYGLVNAVVETGEGLRATYDRARLIAGKSRRAVTIGKRAFYRQIELPMVEAYREMATVMVENMLETDAERGISAFLNKTQAEWSHQ